MANGHGGARPNTGGKRPGAGRPTKTTESYQAQMRGVFADVVRQRDWEIVVRSALARAQAGDPKAREWLGQWIVGKVPDEVNHEGVFSVKLKWSDGDGKIASD